MLLVGDYTDVLLELNGMGFAFPVSESRGKTFRFLVPIIVVTLWIPFTIPNLSFLSSMLSFSSKLSLLSNFLWEWSTDFYIFVSLLSPGFR